jgi:hypothetical protein
VMTNCCLCCLTESFLLRSMIQLVTDCYICAPNCTAALSAGT